MTQQKHVLLLIIVVLLLSACSGTRHSLYDAAMDREIRRAGLEARSVDVKGMEIALLESERQSDQETLVLIHGFGANGLNWLRLSQELKGDYHIVVPDLPGHGKSTQDPELQYGIPNQVEYLAALLETLDIQSAHLAGNSMGGAISALYSATFPDQVLSLSLINPAGIHEHPSELDEQLAQGNNPLVVDDTDDYSDLLDFVMEKKPFIPWPVSSVMAEKAVNNREINKKIFADIRQGSSEEFRDALTTIKAPTLILWGRLDRVISADNAQVFDELVPNSTVVIFDDIGHVPMIEVPERTAQAVLNVTNSGESEMARK